LPNAYPLFTAANISALQDAELNQSGMNKNNKKYCMCAVAAIAIHLCCIPLHEEITTLHFKALLSFPNRTYSYLRRTGLRAIISAS
jgi:hypothetical protein